MIRRSIKSRRLARRVTLQTGLLLLTLAACASQTPTPVTSPAVAACAAFSRITFDRLNDTAPTITQIKAYDAARDALCGVGK